MPINRLKKYCLENKIDCCFCGIILDKNNISVDHICPKSLKGNNYISNYLICCKTCNNKKGSKTIEEFLIEDLLRFKFIKAYLKLMSGFYFYNKLKRKTENYTMLILNKYKILKCKR